MHTEEERDGSIVRIVDRHQSPGQLCRSGEIGENGKQTNGCREDHPTIDPPTRRSTGLSRKRTLEVDEIRSSSFTATWKAFEMSFAAQFLQETVELVRDLDCQSIDALAEGLGRVRDDGGRLFILGVGGSAGHAGHAVNDFRKICSFESYAPTDNVSELTARTNDEGWETTFSAWLTTSRLCDRDAVLVFSVGGGDSARHVSPNIVHALRLAQERSASIFGIVGRDGGFTAQTADVCVVIPPRFAERVTPHTEGLCAVVWHLLVSHPALATGDTKWESITAHSPSDPSRRGA